MPRQLASSVSAIPKGIHYRAFGTCGHVVSQCRCPGLERTEYDLPTPCSECAEAIRLREAESRSLEMRNGATISFSESTDELKSQLDETRSARNATGDDAYAKAAAAIFQTEHPTAEQRQRVKTAYYVHIYGQAAAPREPLSGVPHSVRRTEGDQR